MSFEAASKATFAEQQESEHPEDFRLAQRPAEAVALIRSYLTSLSKSLGEGPLVRDVALFLAESLEEEASRLYRVLAGHSRESRAAELFEDMARRREESFHQLRDVVLELI